MYSYVTKDKEVLDWGFKKFKYGYSFYIGERMIGQLFRPHRRRNGWTAVSWSNPGNMVDGFISRYKAAEYLLKLYDKKEKGEMNE